ncbi:L-lysine 6-transaminase [Streptomyces sp. NPDC102405]|uniref:L-lysine 6-transaminase n=1 Tax=Streptomyces sp. NPDC102405 TaxID=3366170 RepID=UPI0038010502
MSLSLNSDAGRTVVDGATGGNAGQVIEPGEVRSTLARHVLADGYDFILDTDKSQGSWLVDAVSGTRYLDFFSFFASSPLGMNPPQLVQDPEFMGRLAAAAVNKPSNPDVYTLEYAHFVTTFARVLGDPELPYLFFVDGGALAVENALKAAFDWKARRTARRGKARSINFKIMHLEKSFHGRSGYTLSLTNTEPAKTELFPKFDWPRIPSPAARFPLDVHAEANATAEEAALHAARKAFEESDDDIAAFIAEPIQGEGGDNHLRAEFLLAMQELCREYDALFILDEVQTGCGLTGSAWAYQQLGLEPDLVAFGKKTQVCGVMGGRRIDQVDGHVFQTSSRISSTWGGNLADMVRATRIFEVIESEGLIEAAAQQGAYLLNRLTAVAGAYPHLLDNPRGAGLMCAVDLPDAALRDRVVGALYRDEHVIALPCGERSMRFRPPLTVTEDEIDAGLQALDRCLAAI